MLTTRRFPAHQQRPVPLARSAAWRVTSYQRWPACLGDGVGPIFWIEDSSEQGRV